MFITEITKDSKYYDKFLNLVEEAQNSVDKLNSNYKTIQKTYHNYETFCMIMNDEDPVGFFGMQKYENAVRSYTRYFLSEKYRFYNKERTYFHASQYILPWSLRWAKDNEYDFLFVSLQSDLQRKRIARILTNDANKYTNVEWTLLDKLYNTCNGNPNKPQCWQHIVRHTINKGATWKLKQQE
tara:strand:- start:218 stop:766 length:549 start_codon:yes stop_codon:yes gene_type:complete